MKTPPRYHRRRSPEPERRRDAGFTLMEIVVVCFILAIAIIPMLSAFVPGRDAVQAERRLTVFTHRARGTLNRLRSLDYSVLAANSGDPVHLQNMFGSSDEAERETFIFDGTTYVPVVSVQDVSGTTGGLVEITVTAGDVTLRTLRAEY